MVCAAVYMVRSQLDLLLAMHHTFVGTAPPLPLKGESLKGARKTGRVLQGAPSLVAPLVVNADEAATMASVHPPTPISTYIQRVLQDPDCMSVFAQKDGRVSPVILHFAGAAPQLAALVRHDSSLAYTQVSPSPYLQ